MRLWCVIRVRHMSDSNRRDGGHAVDGAKSRLGLCQRLMSSQEVR